MVWQWGDSGIVGRVAIHVLCVEASETAKDEKRTIKQRTIVAAAAARLLVIHDSWYLLIYASTKDQLGNAVDISITAKVAAWGF